MGSVALKRFDMLEMDLQQQLWRSVQTIAELNAVGLNNGDAKIRNARDSFDEALQSGTNPHEEMERSSSPFSFACDHGMSREIRQMIEFGGGIKALIHQPAIYLEECEIGYFHTSNSGIGAWEEELSSLLDHAAAESDWRENGPANAGSPLRRHLDRQVSSD